jgi:hypothetical protein
MYSLTKWLLPQMQLYLVNKKLPKQYVNFSAFTVLLFKEKVFWRVCRKLKDKNDN